MNHYFTIKDIGDLKTAVVEAIELKKDPLKFNSLGANKTICLLFFNNSFLVDKEKDEAEVVLNGFKKYASIPIVNMESSVAHPLQALADAITLKEHHSIERPKIVLSWAPHPKALPHAVANSFINMMKLQDAEFVIANPEGYDLNPEITKGCQIVHDQEKALKNANFVYVKNWSSYDDYGKVLPQSKNWMMTKEKLGTAKFMHCLPVRRNVVVPL